MFKKKTPYGVSCTTYVLTSAYLVTTVQGDSVINVSFFLVEFMLLIYYMELRGRRNKDSKRCVASGICPS